MFNKYWWFLHKYSRKFFLKGKESTQWPKQIKNIQGVTAMFDRKGKPLVRIKYSLQRGRNI